MTTRIRVPPTENRHAGASEDMSLLAVLSVVLRHRRLVIGLPILFIVGAVAISLVKQRSFTSAAAFIPQKPDALRSSPIAGVAAQFGVSVSSGQPAESPAFYAELIGTRTVLATLAAGDYEITRNGTRQRQALPDLLRIRGAERERQEKTIRYLKKAVQVNTSRETSIVSVAVTTVDPRLAKDIADRLLALVNQFNVERRQSQAKAERRFVEARLQEAKAGLHLAEDRLQAFLQRNRQFRNSPELTFENDRRQREVDMAQQVYTSLAETYERARIEEVRNSPVITIVEEPSVPVRPNARGTTVRALTGLCLGLLIALMAAFTREYFRRSRGAALEDFEVFEALRRQAVQDVRGLFRRRPQPAGVPVRSAPSDRAS